VQSIGEDVSGVRLPHYVSTFGDIPLLSFLFAPFCCPARFLHP